MGVLDRAPRRLVVFCICGLMLLAGGTSSGFAVAGDQAKPLAPLQYKGYFSGLPVADVTLALNGGEAAYDVRMEIEARGVIGWFYTWHGELTAAGGLAEGRKPLPQSFSRSWKDTEDSGETVITYDDLGVALGVEDGEPQEQVPRHLRRSVVDPLATLVAMRRLVLLDRMGPARFNVYDGKRRLDLHAELGVPKMVEINGFDLEVAPVTATIEPVAGFSDRQEQGWSETTLTVLFSNDAKALPVQIRIHSPVGTAVMNLTCIGTCV